MKEVGALKGSSRVAEESEIAKYWYENSTQGWTGIARNIATDRGLDLHDSARLLAGLHFTSAVEAGYAQGDRIGTYVAQNLLRPLAAR